MMTRSDRPRKKYGLLRTNEAKANVSASKRSESASMIESNAISPT